MRRNECGRFYFPRRVGVVLALWFTAAAAIVLWPTGGWAQSETQATFTPATDYRFEARSVPAKVTGEADSALASKSYVKIGTVHAEQPGKKARAEVTNQLESAILQKASEAGGDVVSLYKEGVLKQTTVGTGKYSLGTCHGWHASPGGQIYTASPSHR
jgi:hypothetical protein